MLKNLIEWLEKQDENAVVPYGFGEPHSYRGDYSQLAFDPVENAKIGDMLAHARSALGETFEGYKGGEFTMNEYTDCYIAEYGTCGDADRIGRTMLNLWEAWIKQGRKDGLK